MCSAFRHTPKVKVEPALPSLVLNSCSHLVPTNMFRNPNTAELRTYVNGFFLRGFCNMWCHGAKELMLFEIYYLCTQFDTFAQCLLMIFRLTVVPSIHYIPTSIVCVKHDMNRSQTLCNWWFMSVPIRCSDPMSIRSN